MGAEYELDDVSIEQTAGLMAQIQEHVKKLRTLQWAMLEAEEAFKKAQKTITGQTSNIRKTIAKNAKDAKNKS